MAEMATSMPKPSAPKAKVETISNRQIAMQLATKHGLTKKAGNLIMDDLVAMITKQLKKGTRIRLNGLGILQVRKRAARMGRNPATGEAIKIKASKKVAFRAAKEMKKAIKPTLVASMSCQERREPRGAPKHPCTDHSAARCSPSRLT